MSRAQGEVDCADDQRAKAEGKFKLDFSGLKRQQTAARGGKEREALDTDFKSEIEEREKTLSKAAPNLKALQQFEAVKVMPRALTLLQGHVLTGFQALLVNTERSAACLLWPDF